MNKKILKKTGFIRVDEIRNMFGNIDTVIYYNPVNKRIIAWQKNFGYYEVIDKPHLVERYSSMFSE